MPKIAYVSKRFSAKSWVIIEKANEIIAEYAAQGFSLTLRQLYYQFVARDIIPNTMQSYHNLGNVINDARLAGEIDWRAIVDRTRNLQIRSRWESPAEIVAVCADQFHVDMWERQQYHVEVWVEKEALVDVVGHACHPMDVPYFACRGYVSQSEMWEAAQRYLKKEKLGKDLILIHLGDHDPSGIDMTRDINERFEMFMGGVSVERIALNMDQVRQYNPPPNPAKTTDSRFIDYKRKFGEESWELDAIDPKAMSELIEKKIWEYVDLSIWDEDEEREKEGRARLRKVAAELKEDNNE